MKDEKTLTLKRGLAPYYSSMVTFLLFLALLLLTVVDIRRGFLFSSDYFTVGVPAVVLNLHLGHLPLLLIGGLSVWLAYRWMTGLEKGLDGRRLNLKTLTMILAIIIGALLVIDLFTYRGVPTERFLEAGEMGSGPGPMGIGRTIPIANLPWWLQPLGEGINYLLVVWHAATLSMFIGGLFLVAAGAGLMAKLQSRGFGSHLAGVALALPQPFCSCCAAPIGGALYRKGASLGAVLAFTIASPMLNITAIILAASLLPIEFALLRIAGGVIVAVFLTYIVSLIASRWITAEETEIKHDRLLSWSTKLMTAYSRLFNFEKLVSQGTPNSPAALISDWLRMTGRLAKIVIPMLLVTASLTAYVVRMMPDTGNNLFGVIITSFFGTLLMVPTWTEIPFAAGMIAKGFPAIAATALLVLPAVSIPCLIIIAGAVGRTRVAITTGLAVFAVGIVAGIIFL